jgi:hypothetical protein
MILSCADLAAIARSNYGGNFRGIRELQFDIDKDGCIADCRAVVTGKPRDYAGPGLSRAADIALARWDRQGQQQCQIIEFKRSSMP